MARAIRSVLTPLEASERMYNAFRAFYKAITTFNKEKNQKAERFHAVLESNDIVDASYDTLRYTLLSQYAGYLQSLEAMAKANPQYMEMAIANAEKAKELFEKSRKSEREAMKKCDFLRRQSIHLRESAKNISKNLKRLRSKKLREAQRQQAADSKRFQVKEGKRQKGYSRKERDDAMKRMKDAQPKGRKEKRFDVVGGPAKKKGKKVDVVGGPNRDVANF